VRSRELTQEAFIKILKQYKEFFGGEGVESMMAHPNSHLWSVQLLANHPMPIRYLDFYKQVSKDPY